jgi:hypothetical protein
VDDIMTRMSREFTLVLLGSGLLTAGYFMLPEDDPVQRAEKAAADRVGGDGHHHRTGGMHALIFFGGGRASTAVTNRGTASGITNRGGFGRTGGFVSGLS